MKTVWRVACAALVCGSLAATPVRVVAADDVVGVWTLNRDLSDRPPQGRGADAGGERRGGGGEEGRRGGGGGRGGRGGIGGGFGGGGFGAGERGGARGGDPAEARRQMDAMRDLMTPADRLTIVRSDDTVIMTGADGRTTRLATTGKSIKEENTGIERKTKWSGQTLQSEVSGLRGGKITQTWAVDPETHRLRVTTTLPEGRGGGSQPATLTAVYDAAGL